MKYLVAFLLVAGAISWNRYYAVPAINKAMIRQVEDSDDSYTSAVRQQRDLVDFVPLVMIGLAIVVLVLPKRRKTGGNSKDNETSS
jgi:hypothetical protein